MNYKVDISYVINGRIGYTHTWVVTATDSREAYAKGRKLATTSNVVITVAPQANDDSFDNGCQ